jgi:hypothetical protein
MHGQAKPESARKQIPVLGQRARIWATMRAISSRAPAEASMLERRSLAASRCRPQRGARGLERGDTGLRPVPASARMARTNCQSHDLGVCDQPLATGLDVRTLRACVTAPSSCLGRIAFVLAGSSREDLTGTGYLLSNLMDLLSALMHGQQRRARLKI